MAGERAISPGGRPKSKAVLRAAENVIGRGIVVKNQYVEEISRIFLASASARLGGNEDAYRAIIARWQSSPASARNISRASNHQSSLASGYLFAIAVFEASGARRHIEILSRLFLRRRCSARRALSVTATRGIVAPISWRRRLR
jgi:hypothetical protein